MAIVAAGCSTHTAWAWLVAVAQPASLVARERLEIDAARRMAPYHEAQALDDLDRARAHMDQAIEVAHVGAVAALGAAIDRLRDGGHDVVAVGVLGKPEVGLPPLDRILRSHALLHAAEGELYREALLAAAEELGVPATRALPSTAHDAAVAAIGKAAGAPWQKDHKQAAALALDLLAGRTPGGI